MSVVRLESVKKNYGPMEVIHGIDLDIASGEFVVFVGPSGCGKSTLLRMISGLETTTAGRIFIDKTDVTRLAPGARHVSMVFQSYALYPHMTARENMSFGLLMTGTRKAEVATRVAEAARILQIEPLMERKPKQLSGGQRQRVAIGRAIVREPNVFLFDEPLSNLDAALRVQMRVEIARLHSEIGATMIYVTHDQVEAMTMGDRMAVMKAGVLQQAGPPQQVYDHPNNIFVAQCVGSPPMNLVQGVVSQQGDDLSVRVGDAELAIPAAVVGARPSLRSYVGKPVAVGVRSEDMEDASLQPDTSQDQQLSGTVTLVEALGSEIVVHFSLKGDTVVTEDTKLVAEDAGEEALDMGPAGEVRWVASFSPRSGVRRGDHVGIVVDMERVHWFDPSTGEAIRG